MKVMWLVAVVVVVATSESRGEYQGQGNAGGHSPSSPASYSYMWQVDDPPSGNHYRHDENREGTNTEGSYFVQLPGDHQLKVEYVVDESGFRPMVTYGIGSAAGGAAQNQGYVRAKTAAPASPSQIYSAHQQPNAPTPSPFYI